MKVRDSQTSTWADGEPVSILMPVYNANKFLDLAIDSILSQTHANFEFIILDDGSTDGSADLIRARAAVEPRIRAVFQKNEGIAISLARLVALARHSLIARMDSDDVARPTRIAKQVAYLAGHPRCVAVGTKAMFVDPEGGHLFPFIDWFSHDEVDAQLMRPMIGLLHPTVMMRRSAVLNAGSYRSDFRHVEDLDLFLRLSERGSVANIDEILLEYRLHPKSVSHAHAREQHVNGLLAVKCACERRGIEFSREADLSSPRVHIETADQLHAKWTWMALSAGNVAAARKHALLAVRNAPFKRINWTALACAVRGH